MLSLFTISAGRIEAAARNDLSFVLGFRGMTVAVGSGRLHGPDLASGLFADLFAVEEDSTLEADQAICWGGIVWRLGGGARRFLLGDSRWTAPVARAAGLCDAIVPAGDTAAGWVRRWVGDRDLIALESAAVLLRHRSGDVLERSEFGRLFAAGIPQEGLAAFLERKRSRN